MREVPGRRVRWSAALLGATMVLAVVLPAHAEGPTVSIEPSGPFADDDQTITVTGSGFDPVANGGVGIYVVYGPLTDAPTYYTDAERYAAARWVHPGAVAGPGQAALAPDGSFTMTLDIQPRYVDGHEAAIDCVATPCHIITMAAHGVADRSQDTFTIVRFDPAIASTAGQDSLPAAIAIALLVAVAVVVVASLVRWRHRSGRLPG